MPLSPTFHKSNSGFSPIIIVGGVLIVLLAGFVGYKYFYQSSNDELVSAPVPEVSASPVVSPTASVAASLKPVIKKSPIPSVKPSLSPLPTSSVQSSSAPATSPTPTPAAKEALDAGYSITPSETNVTMKISKPTTGYAVYALLKKNGSVVTQQSDFEYSWSSDDPWIIESRPFDGCIEGIQSPCPLDHNNMNGRHSGTAKLSVKIRKISENIIVAKQEYAVTVTEN